MSIDITHLENKPELDNDISSDSEEVPKKKHKSEEAVEEPEPIVPPSEMEVKEKEMLQTMLELYKISFPKLKPFSFNSETDILTLRSIKQSCDAQLSAGSSIDVFESLFFNFLTGIEVLLTKKGFDLTGFSYLCANDESIKTDLRLIVIKLASSFSPKPEFRLIMNVMKMGGTAYVINNAKKQEADQNNLINNQNNVQATVQTILPGQIVQQ